MNKKIKEISHYFLNLDENKVNLLAKDFNAHPDSMRWWIKEMFIPWTKEKSKKINPNPKKVLYVFAKNTPAHIVSALMLAIINEENIHVKIPSNCNYIFEVFKFFLNPSKFHACNYSHDDSSFEEMLNKMDSVHVYGNEKTINSFKEKNLKNIQYYGPQISIAIIDQQDVNNIKTWEKFTRDFILFDSKGCMSPQILFINNCNQKIINTIITNWIETNLKPISKIYPKGPDILGEKLQRYELSAQYQFLGNYWTDKSHQYFIGMLNDSTLPEIFLPRFIHIRFFSHLSDIKKTFHKSRLSIKNVALSESLSGNQIDVWKEELKIENIVSLGSIQIF